MTWLADNWALALLAALFGSPAAWGIARSIRAEFDDRARDRLGREVESVPVHDETYVTDRSALS